MHTDGAATDWTQVLALYDQLLALTPTPIVALNRAVAVAEVHGPAPALAAIEDLDLPGYHLLPATRADLLARLGRDRRRPAPPTTRPSPWPRNDTERAFLEGRRASLDTASAVALGCRAAAAPGAKQSDRQPCGAQSCASPSVSRSLTLSGGRGAGRGAAQPSSQP